MNQNFIKMNKYLLLLHEQVDLMQNLSPTEMEELIGSHIAWASQLAEEGHLIVGEGLQDSGITITGKESVLGNSTYLEAKEMIGGFYLIQAIDIDSAIEIAKNCPCHHYGGTTEIRPIAVYDEE